MNMPRELKLMLGYTHAQMAVYFAVPIDTWHRWYKTGLRSCSAAGRRLVREAYEKEMERVRRTKYL